MMKAFRGLMLSYIALCMCSTPLFARTLTLPQAIEEAVTNNPGLLKAGHEIQSVEAGLWEAVSPDNPEVFAEFEEIPRGSRSLSDYSGRKIGFAQEFEFPLSYYYRGKLYNKKKIHAYSVYKLLRNDVVVEIRKSFFKVLLIEKKIQLSQDSARLTQELFEKAKIRVEAGESAPYDTLRVKIDLAEAENGISVLNSEHEAALYELKLLLGRRKDDAVEIEGDLQFSSLSLDQDSLKQVAMDNHPLLRDALSTADQMKIKKKLSWLGLVPHFKLSYFRQDFRDKAPPKAWGTEIGLSVPFWAIMKERGNIRAASHELEAARWQIEVEKRKVLLNVEEAFSNLFIAEKHVMNYRDNILSEVKELVRIATRSYEEGEMGYLEVTEAYKTLNRTNAGYYDAIYAYLSAQADLDKAVGVSHLGESY